MGVFYGCGLLQMASHSKEVAVVAESIRCLGQEIEQYEVCSPEFNLKSVNLYLCYNYFNSSRNVEIYYSEKEE